MCARPQSAVRSAVEWIIVPTQSTRMHMACAVNRLGTGRSGCDGVRHTATHADTKWNAAHKYIWKTPTKTALSKKYRQVHISGEGTQSISGSPCWFSHAFA